MKNNECIFISYSTNDQKLAFEISDFLEKHNLSVWIAPKNINPGLSYASQLTDGIDASEIFLLILSENSNTSQHVAREVERAVSKKKPIVTLKISDVKISKEMEYYLNSTHWLDSFNQDNPLDLNLLLSAVMNLKKLNNSSEIAQERNYCKFWHVPLPVNIFFTGREDIIEKINQSLNSDRPCVALHGLSGVGKTQIAVQYAYRNKNKYTAILWVEAESQETFTSNYASLSDVLNPPLQNEKESQKIISVDRWLETNRDWLLIINNANDFKTIISSLKFHDTGHYIFTTETRATNFIAEPIEIREMNDEEGAYLVLRRSNLVQRKLSLSETKNKIDLKVFETAKLISKMLGGLPLALDQAGGYIEQTQCNLDEYVNELKSNSFELMKERGMTLLLDHPNPVSSTWLLTLKRIKEKNPVSVELLYFFSFLYPDFIPEEIITGGARFLGEKIEAEVSVPYKLNLILGDIINYSLIRRNKENKNLSIHRLLQLTIQQDLSETEKREWALRITKILYLCFPNVAVTTYSQCNRLISNIQDCMDMIKLYKINTIEAAILLNQAGHYSFKIGNHFAALQFHEAALKIWEALDDYELDRNYSVCLNDLARVYKSLGNFSMSMRYYKDALVLRSEKNIGTEQDLANTLNDIGMLHTSEGKFEKAREFHEKALDIRIKLFGDEHRDVAAS